MANGYIKNYNQLRPYLRLYVYGCFDKRYMAKHFNVSIRTCEDTQTILMRYLPANRLTVINQKQHKIYSLNGNAYLDEQDYLARLYRLNTVKANKAFYAISILQILNALTSHDYQGPACIPFTELKKILIGTCNNTDKFIYTSATIESNALFHAKGDKSTCIDINTLRNNLKDLEKSGLIHIFKDSSRSDKCQLATNPLHNLSTKENTLLRCAICYYRLMAPTALPGYYLEAKLKQMETTYQLNAPPISLPIQMQHTYLTRIIDEYILLPLIYCIQNQQSCRIKLQYTDNTHAKKILAIYPLSISTDFRTGRQYLIYLTINAMRHPRRRYHPMQIRLENIAEVTATNQYNLTINAKLQDKHKLELELHTTTTNLLKLQKRLYEHFPTITFSAPPKNSKAICIAKTKVSDLHAQIPWLLSLQPYIVPINPELRCKIHQRIKEAINNYAKEINQ